VVAAVAVRQGQPALAIYSGRKKNLRSLAVLVDTFKASLDPLLFKLYRRYLYSRHKATDELAQGEVVHEVAKERLAKLAGKFADNAPYFDPGEQLAVSVNGLQLKSPVGVAAGFDKNCDMLLPMSYVFGYLNPGSILLKPRAGNPQKPKSEGTVRMLVDDDRQAIINAQGYPHKGLDHVVRNLDRFAKSPRGKAKTLLNFSGITDTYTEDAVLDACKEIITRTLPYVDLGFEENRTSPNTDFNRVLQSPAFTKKMVDLMNAHAPGKLKASKIAPYSQLPPTDAERKERLESIRVFYENGGHAVVIGNTRPVDTKSNPLTRGFARPVAGESGRPLFPYMLRMVEDVHRAFPDLTIIACGGIWDGEDAWKAYEKGATLVQLYTALTFQGFGIVKQIHDTIKKKLGKETLQGYVDKRDRL
jgi:dihydroorotate dehydrogenase